MKNKNLKMDHAIMLINRVNNNLTFYISKKLLLDLNDKSKNILITEKGLMDFDYFEVELNINKHFLSIYKPHYYGKQTTNLLYYIDKHIIEWMEDLSGENIMEVYNNEK